MQNGVGAGLPPLARYGPTEKGLQYSAQPPQRVSEGAMIRSRVFDCRYWAPGRSWTGAAGRLRAAAAGSAAAPTVHSEPEDRLERKPLGQTVQAGGARRRAAGGHVWYGSRQAVRTARLRRRLGCRCRAMWPRHTSRRSRRKAQCGRSGWCAATASS